MNRGIWNLANCLTLSRFITAPLFILLLIRLEQPHSGGPAWAALGLLVVTLLTDMFDGMAARRQQQVTDFGKIMDPVADSTFFLTALFGFAASERFEVPVWIPLVVLYREIGMHVLRRYAALAGYVLAAKTSGKAKMACQSLVLVALLAAVGLNDSGRADLPVLAIVYWGLVAVAAVNVLSLVEYLAEIPALARRRREQTAGGED